MHLSLFPPPIPKSSLSQITTRLSQLLPSLPKTYQSDRAKYTPVIPLLSTLQHRPSPDSQTPNWPHEVCPENLCKCRFLGPALENLDFINLMCYLGNRWAPTSIPNTPDALPGLRTTDPLEKLTLQKKPIDSSV